MFKAWYLPFYKYGIIHGDPHLGNYSADKNLNINLLDFGCIRFLNLHLFRVLLICIIQLKIIMRN